MERIGIVAGGGRLPVIFANEARKKGIHVVGFAIKDMALPEFDLSCDKAHRLALNEIKKFFFLLLAERVKKIVLLGKVDKSVIYNYAKKDKKAASVLEDSRDRSDYAILDKITDELKKIGVEVIDGLAYLSDLLPPKGVLTKRNPSAKEIADVDFGFKLAKEIARLDMGQTIVVKDKAVVSIEAMEGTDNTIKRAAQISGGGFTVVKVSRPAQDMRWDVPVIGPETVRLIAENKGKVLAMEGKRLFFLQKELCVKLADNNDISIVVI